MRQVVNLTLSHLQILILQGFTLFYKGSIQDPILGQTAGLIATNGYLFRKYQQCRISPQNRLETYG